MHGLHGQGGRQARASRARPVRPAAGLPREAELQAQHQAGVRGRRGPPAAPQGGVPLPLAQVPREGPRQEQAGETDQEGCTGRGMLFILQQQQLYLTHTHTHTAIPACNVPSVPRQSKRI